MGGCWSKISYDAYRIAVRVHLIPGVGEHRLRPEHLERLYRRMIATGARPATAHQVHRTIRTALGGAVRRRQVQENVATLARAPKSKPRSLSPTPSRRFGASSVRLGNAATRHDRPLHSRWVFAKARCSACTGQMSILSAEFSRSQRTGFDRITNTVAQPRAGRLRATALAVYKPTRTTDRPSPVPASERSDCRPSSSSSWKITAGNKIRSGLGLVSSGWRRAESSQTGSAAR